MEGLSTNVRRFYNKAATELVTITAQLDNGSAGPFGTSKGSNKHTDGRSFLINGQPGRKRIHCIFIQHIFAMFVKVAQLYEGGRPLPKHRSIRMQPTMIGQLRLTEEYSREFRRNVVYAFLHTSSGTDLIPRLHDAVVQYIADGCMTITGFERDEVNQCCQGQSWFVQAYLDSDTE